MFHKCCTKHHQKGLGESNNKFQDYLKNLNENSFFFKEIEPDEIYGIIKISAAKIKELQ